MPMGGLISFLMTTGHYFNPLAKEKRDMIKQSIYLVMFTLVLLTGCSAKEATALAAADQNANTDQNTNSTTSPNNNNTTGNSDSTGGNAQPGDNSGNNSGTATPGNTTTEILPLILEQQPAIDLAVQTQSALYFQVKSLATVLGNDLNRYATLMSFYHAPAAVSQALSIITSAENLNNLCVSGSLIDDTLEIAPADTKVIIKGEALGYSFSKCQTATGVLLDGKFGLRITLNPDRNAINPLQLAATLSYQNLVVSHPGNYFYALDGEKNIKIEPFSNGVKVTSYIVRDLVSQSGIAKIIKLNQKAKSETIYTQTGSMASAANWTLTINQNYDLQEANYLASYQLFNGVNNELAGSFDAKGPTLTKGAWRIDWDNAQRIDSSYNASTANVEHQFFSDIRSSYDLLYAKPWQSLAN